MGKEIKFLLRVMLKVYAQPLSYAFKIFHFNKQGIQGIQGIQRIQRKLTLKMRDWTFTKQFIKKPKKQRFHTTGIC